MGDNNGILSVVAALILGASVVAGSLFIGGAIDRSSEQLAGLRSAVGAIQAAAPAAAPSRQAARPSRPDPNRRYTVDTKGSPSRGPENAKVAVVEFSDFQCPYCARVTPTLKQIESTYGDDVRVVFKHLPLQMHSKAPAAHAASIAAQRQGKFWEMHDRIFGNQREMSPEKYEEYAAELGLDVDQFKRDAASPEIKRKIDADLKEATRLGVTSTPGFFINGRYLSGARPFDSFKELIDAELGRG